MTTDDSTPTPASGETALLESLVQTSFAVVDAITAVATRHDMSLTLWRVVAILRDRTPTMSDLADHLRLDRSTITGLVDRAVVRGLLHKSGDELDRRSNRVTLTEAGQALARTCEEELVNALSPFTSRLPVSEHGHLTRLLTVLGNVT